ncbi:MAG TPA: hypothetical protein VKS43_16515 [Burkholderiales bacterium]|nr:hypothetical protein [Burkholderiales bacterium]
MKTPHVHVAVHDILAISKRNAGTGVDHLGIQEEKKAACCAPGIG